MAEAIAIAIRFALDKRGIWCCRMHQINDPEEMNLMIKLPQPCDTVQMAEAQCPE